jgi:hypothetical protein
MSTLDEITKERQRVGEALARVDAQRDKLASQLGELEAAERVLARYSKGTGAKNRVSMQTTSKADAAARPRRRPRNKGAKPVASEGSTPTLSERVLALANGKTQPEIAAACKGARPNHVGMAIARHKRAGRIKSVTESSTPPRRLCAKVALS